MRQTHLENNGGRNCLNCGMLLDAASDPLGKAKPKPGDFTICLYCGHLMAFGLGLALRELTDSEMLHIAGDRDMIKIQRARAEVMARRAARGEGHKP